MSRENTPAPIRIDERQQVEKPLLDQLAGLGWEILGLDAKQRPADSHRTNFTEVVMVPVLRERLKAIQPWLEEDQVDDLVKQITASFPGGNLLQNNQHVFELLTRGRDRCRESEDRRAQSHGALYRL